MTSDRQQNGDEFVSPESAKPLILISTFLIFTIIFFINMQSLNNKYY